MRFDNGPRLVITVPAGQLTHPLPDTPAAVALVLQRLAPHIPTPATWQVER